MSQRKPEGGAADPAQPIDRAPGTYVLILELTTRKVIQVGALGRIKFTAGWYAYAGSAFGPGGLAARINRHLMSAKKPHWHIDYHEGIIVGLYTITSVFWGRRSMPPQTRAVMLPIKDMLVELYLYTG
jgi:hypothetical protein